jgi:hypothetical protein
MANGDRGTRSANAEQFTMIDGATGTTDGVWIDTADFAGASLEITIAGGTATVEIDGTNVDAKPANNTHGTAIGSTFTSSDFGTIRYSPRWTKARITALSGATVNVLANFRRNGG